ncbi:glycosyltransferase family 2 protein [Allorhizocola rhizosphaerae]|uniref:glycosyltransferase family 2 protein n=1 Tax=Allorhizocola rhizosphaerae TaxID=1872709 RepID=UPI000E3CB251|nr:glycosyltransferase family A protein [Allorhizocola rhizosphaerae]
MLRPIKRQLRSTFGLFPLYEVRNKVALAHTAIGLSRFENAEVRSSSVRPHATVAVILLTCRRPEGLLAALDSVLKQTFQDFVVMVVDDGGPLTELPPDPRVHAITLSRNIHCLGVSRNIGMRLTESEFVAFLDDDNTWHPDHLEVALGRLQQPGAPDAVYTAMRRITPDGQLHDILSVPFDRKHASNASFLDSNPFVARRSPDLMFSRLRRTRTTAPKEDWEMIYRYSRRHRIEHIPQPTVDYLVNPTSFWTTWNK